LLEDDAVAQNAPELALKATGFNKSWGWIQQREEY